MIPCQSPISVPYIADDQRYTIRDMRGIVNNAMDLREYISYLTGPWPTISCTIGVPPYTYNNTLNRDWGLL